MSKIHVEEIRDYLFCPEYQQSKRKQHAYLVYENERVQQERYEKRKKLVELHAKLRKEISEAQGKPIPTNWFLYILFDLKWKKIDISLILWVTTAIILGYYFDDYVYFFLFAPAIYFTAREWRSPVFHYLKRKVPTHRLLEKEKKYNPSLILYDFTTSPSIYGKVDVVEKNRYYHVLLDRSDEPIPKSEKEKSLDEMELVALMHLFHTHFFTRRIIGQIQYQNGLRKIEWMGKQNQLHPKVKKYLKEIQNIAKELKQNPSSTPPPLSHCQRCKQSSQCPSYRERINT